MSSGAEGPVFETQPQVQAGYWYLFVLPVLLLALVVVLVVRSPSVYWVLPAVTALVAIVATYRVRRTTTHLSTVLWLVVALGADVGAVLWLVPLMNSGLRTPF